jgi:imidazolonepropionase-like amidohydrolase
MARAKGFPNRPDTIYLKNALVIDGTGREPVGGGVVIVGDRIKHAGFVPRDFSEDDAEVIDLAGRAVMPGMILANVRLGHRHVKDLTKTDLRPRPERATITAVNNARLMLDCGYTAGITAGALHCVDVHVRDAIQAGHIPGPRLLAAGRDLCPTGSPLDRCETAGIVADGPWEVRKAVRRLIREGVDVVRLHAGGEALLPGDAPAEVACTQDEITALAGEAHRRGLLCAVHTRSAEGARMAARAGVDLVDRATSLDEQTLDLLAEAGCGLVPGLDQLVGALEYARNGGFAWMGSYNDFLDRTHCEEELAEAVETVARAHRRGIPVLIGSGFGFCWCPHGCYGRELTHLVHLVGLTPMAALLAATRHGAVAMGRQHELGTLEPGKLADLIVIEGNPLHDIALLEERKNIRLVMKGGVWHRRPSPEPELVYA